MENALKMGKVSAMGSFQLFIGQSISSIILAIGSIILGRIMLPADYGLYSIALVPSMTFTLFHDWGIGVATTRYVAHLRSENNSKEIRDIVAVGLMFKAMTGLILTIISLLSANYLAIFVFNRPESAPLISIASLAIISESLLRASKSNFTGFEKMTFTSVILIFQSILKTVAAPLLLLLGYGALGAVIGYTISFVVSAFLGVALVYFSLYKPLRNIDYNQIEKIKTLKKMLRYGFPLSISTLMEGLLVQIYSFLMAIYASDVLIGNYQVALNFAIILSFFSYPITTVLFPMFSKLDVNKDIELLRTIFKSSVKYASMLLVPAAFAVIVMAEPMVNTIFGEKYFYAPFFLSLYVISDLFSGVGGLSLNSFLRSIGETKFLLKLSIVTLIFGSILSFLLIPLFDILGVILVILLSSLPSLLIGLRWIWKNYAITVDWNSSIRIFFASSISAIITYFFLNFFNYSEWMRLLCGAILFIFSYIVIAPLAGAIVQDDIKNLRSMLSGLGFVLKLINLPLRIVEKLANSLTKIKK